jgi:hypothetical protein
MYVQLTLWKESSDTDNSMYSDSEEATGSENVKSTRLIGRTIGTHCVESKLSAAFDPKVLREIEAKISCQMPVSLPTELTG